MFSASEKKLIESIYKELENDHMSAYLVVNCPIKKKLCASFPHVPMEVDSSEDECFDLEGLWSRVVIDYTEWCSYANIPPSLYAMNCIKQIIANKLVLPNGWRHPIVDTMLRMEVKNSLVDMSNFMGRF